MVAVLWLLAAGLSLGCGATLPDVGDGTFIEACLREHNGARAGVRPPATDMTRMSWDAGLAAIARSWARRCVFQHSPGPSEHPRFSSLGENLWVGAPPSHFSVSLAIGGWVNETRDYSYHTDSCRPGRMCGHYTQVVWARSNRVGCAVHLCPNGIQQTGFSSQPGANFVCNYGPAGNVIGQKPFRTGGAACSECEASAACDERLCGGGRDPDRAEASGSGVVSVLIIRPVALLGAVIAAVAVKHFYPDVFCYD
ncbi:glioma pathogenesis-related protein 1 [Eucyclogobius newberryi]|uniref:glioma pathogenesis-related protein 1 n=1 Tax=Eucyclogobius newberryi TaxID=166745 RepID=UPI003B5BB920